MSILIVESWTHTSNEFLTFDDLTDSEVRTITYWLILNRRDYKDRVLDFVKDIRQVFPGISLGLASDLIRGRA